MIVLVKVGEYLTYRYTSNVNSISSEFSEFTPDFSIVVIRDIDSSYFNIIPEQIDPKYLYRPGWYYDVPEVRQAFETYTLQENEVPGYKFKREIREHIIDVILHKLPNTSGGRILKRILQYVSEDLTLASSLPSVVRPGDGIKFESRLLPNITFQYRGITVEILNETNPEGIDPDLQKAIHYANVIRSGHKFSSSKLIISLTELCSELIKERYNPYIKFHEVTGTIILDTEKEREFLEALQTLKEELGK